MATMEDPAKNPEYSPLSSASTRIHLQAPSSGQVKTLLTWLAAGLLVLVLGGLTLFGTSITLALAIPLLIMFSPVLIPLGTVLFLVTAGTVSLVGTGIAVASAASWLFNYFKGRDPPGAERVDAARDRIVCTAREWASNYSSQMRAAPSA